MQGYKMKLVMISDTHSRHKALNGFMPEGDVLIHAGDLTMDGTIQKVQEALDWLNEQPYKHVVVIAGNHDFCFESTEKKDRLNFGRITYLENSGIEIEGVKFWGSPIQPAFFNWAFNVDRGDPIRKYWDMIPKGTDVLITHGPPFKHLDFTPRLENVGCYDLAYAIKRIAPKVHVFGHIHYAYGEDSDGTTFYFNASTCTEMYAPENLPLIFELLAEIILLNKVDKK